MDQSFNASYYLAAVNAGGDITENYHGEFAKLTGTDSFSFGARGQLGG